MSSHTPVRGRAVPILVFAALTALLTGVAAEGRAANVPTGFSDQPVASGLTLPVSMAEVPDEQLDAVHRVTSRILVVEQFSANIVLIRLGPPVTNTVLVKVDSVQTSGNGERGLLGIAIDPGWPARPYVYVHSTHIGNKIRISRFTVTGALNDPNGALAISLASRYELIDDIPDVNFFHNGGSVKFGPDGMLYVSLGEDGSKPAAQDTMSLRGVVLRLDVSRLPAGPGRATRDLITPPDNPFMNNGPNGRLTWAYGLRNPFRIQIDSHNGRVAIADVGENTWEELDIAPIGGMNFGWSHFEGPSVFSPSAPLTGPAIGPIYAMNHSEGVTSIIAGGFYRRPPGATAGFPAEYNGNQFVTDYSVGMLRRLVEASDGTWSIAPPVPGQPSPTDWGDGFDGVTDFFVGGDGALWFLRHSSGEVRRIAGPVSVGVDPPVSGVQFDRPRPVPSSGAVELSGTLPTSQPMRLAIYDVRGRLVRELVRTSEAAPGPFLVRWDGADAHGHRAAAGLYFARLDASQGRLERRVLIVR